MKYKKQITAGSALIFVLLVTVWVLTVMQVVDSSRIALKFSVDCQDQDNTTRRHIKNQIEESHRIMTGARVTWHNRDTKVRITIPIRNYEWGVEFTMRDLETDGSVIEFMKADGTVVMTGSDIKNISVTRGNESDMSAVTLIFTDEGSVRLSDVTKELSQRADGENILIIAMDGHIITAPSVNAPIEDGRASIVIGDFRDAEELKSFLIRGLYPVFTLIED